MVSYAVNRYALPGGSFILIGLSVPHFIDSRENFVGDSALESTSGHVVGLHGKQIEDGTLDEIVFPQTAGKSKNTLGTSAPLTIELSHTSSLFKVYY